MDIEKAFSRYMQYTIKSTIGLGAQGKVKLGTDGQRLYALKFLKNVGNDVSKELAIHKSLSHPNIVELVDFHTNEPYLRKSGKEELRTCLVYNYQEGGELFEYISQTGPFKDEVARYFFQQLISAISYLHMRGIAHRDLKPENILFSNGQLKVTDLGFVTFMGGRQGDGLLATFKGTFGYMAPEIGAKQTYNGQCVDIFALGVILFTMLTGQIPFTQASARDQYYNLICTNRQDQFWALKEKQCNINLSNEVKLLITSMIAFDPLQRPTLAEIVSTSWYSGCLASIDQIRHLLEQRKRKIDAFNEKARLKAKLSKLHKENNPSTNTPLQYGIGKFNRGENDDHITNTRRILKESIQSDIVIPEDPEILFQQLISQANQIANKVTNVSDTKYQFNYYQIGTNNEEFEMKVQLVKVNEDVGIVFSQLKGDRVEYFSKINQIEEFLIKNYG